MLTAIGCVPGAGDAIKSIGKAIIKGADDITIALLKKLDAEGAYRAFVKFRQTLQASTEEAVATINVWLKKLETSTRRPSWQNCCPPPEYIIGEATLIDKKGEKSIDMAIGTLSVSSKLNDKNNTPIIAQGQFDVLSMDANLGIRDEGFEVGANMNIVSASGNIGLSIGTKEMEVRLSTEALEIHDYMHYEKYLEKNYNFNGFAPPPDPLIIKAIGLAKWIEMVDTGHPWDHKPKISSLFRYCSVERFTRKGNLSKSHFHKYKNFDYFYDIWSNIHYGYVGRFCGISEQFLLLGSNLQQLYANLTSWKFFSGDDSADIISMKLGMRLYDEFKDNENGLTYTVVLERLEGLTSVGESRLLHTCLDKSWEGITFV